MAGSIAQASVEIVADGSQVPGQVRQVMNQAGNAASDAGRSAGDDAGEAIGNGVTGKLQSFTSRFAEMGKTWADKLGVTGSVAAVGAAAGIGAAFAGGVSQAMDVQKANQKLAAQLGLSKQESARIGQVAGQMYANNYGESVGDVNDALKSVIQNVGGMANASNKELQSITGSTMKVAKAFDQDIGGVSQAVGQMMKTGMAKNATEALDTITAGFQKIPNAGEDLLDTMNEYGVQFQKVGIDGKTAMGMINQAMQGGARNTDLAADAIKEFSIRAVDGSETTKTGFQQIGLNADEMAQKFGQGGDVAKAALSQTMQALKGVEDPAKRSQAAVALFGTQAEDLGEALYKMDPGTAVQSLGEVGGAAQRMQKTMGETASSALSKFGRQLQMTFVNILGGMVIPLITKAAQILGAVFTPVFTALNGIIGNNTGVLKALGVALAVLVGVIGTIIGITKAWTIAQTALNAVMAMNPIGLVIAGLTALVAAFIYLWNTSEAFRGFWMGLWAAVQAAAAPVIAWFQAAWSAVVVWWMGIWQQIRGPVMAVLGFIGQYIGMQVAMWQAIFSGAMTAIGAVLGGAWQVITSIFQGAIGIITGIWNLFTSLLTGNWSGAWAAIQGIVGAAWGMITGIVSGIAGAVTGIFSGLGAAISGIWSAAWNFLTSTVGGAFHAIVGAVSAGVSNVINTVAQLPGRIQGFFAGAGSWLLDAGRNIIRGLIDGIKGMIGAVGDAIGNVAGKIRDFLPFSPAREGPLSGHGAPIYSGRSIGRQLADGISSQQPLVRRRMRSLMAPSFAGGGVPRLHARPSVGHGALGGTPRTPEMAATARQIHAMTRHSQITRSQHRQVEVHAPITVNSAAANPAIVARKTADRLAALAQG